MVKRTVGRIAWWCVAMAPALVFAGGTITVPSEEARTIALAFIKAKPGDTIAVEPGVYSERVFVETGVTLSARVPLMAVIDGGGRGTAVTLGKNSGIIGFEIRNGTIGVFSKSAGNVIRNCRIVDNWQTGIICVRHLPAIEDNIIAFNRASGIQGWDVRSAGTSIRNNTIAYNSNHGVAMGGRSSVVIEKNIIAFNERFGIKTLPQVEGVKIVSNDFYKNLWSPTPLPSGNFSYDPKFASPRLRKDFTAEGRVACTECAKDDAPGPRTITSRGGDGL